MQMETKKCIFFIRKPWEMFRKAQNWLEPQQKTTNNIKVTNIQYFVRFHEGFFIAWAAKPICIVWLRRTGEREEDKNRDSCDEWAVSTADGYVLNCIEHWMNDTCVNLISHWMIWLTAFESQINDYYTQMPDYLFCVVVYNRHECDTIRYDYRYTLLLIDTLTALYTYYLFLSIWMKHSYLA